MAISTPYFLLVLPTPAPADPEPESTGTGVFDVAIFAPIPDIAFAWGLYRVELYRNLTTGADLDPGPTRIASHTVGGTADRVVIARVDLGGEDGALSDGGGVVSFEVQINGVAVPPESVIQVAEGASAVIVISRPLTLEPGDVITIDVSGRAGDDDVAVLAVLYDASPRDASSATSGDGAILVDHAYGGTDDDPTPLAFADPDGAAIDNATVRAYRKSDYDAGRRSRTYLVAETTTDVAGFWAVPMMLDPATYILLYAKQGSFRPVLVQLIVS